MRPVHTGSTTGAKGVVSHMLEINLLGRFSVALDGRMIEISSQPARTLLVYLVLQSGRPQSREVLAERLWPDAMPANALSNLRHALWRLRRALEPETPGLYLIGDGPAIAFNAAAPYRLDVDCLDADRSAWSAADLLAAAAAYQGELLPGYNAPWIVLERERLAAIFDRRMEDLLSHLVADRRWDEVMKWADHWIAQGEVPEPAYRALMQAHAANDDPASVKLTYRRCREVLAAELGVEPSLQTRRLIEELAAGAAEWEPSPVQPFLPGTPDEDALAVALTQADVERRRAELYLWQVRRLNRLAAGLALGLAAAVGVALAKSRRER
jgi:DNA-binding SARP family transcriptional activator